LCPLPLVLALGTTGKSVAPSSWPLESSPLPPANGLRAASPCVCVTLCKHNPLPHSLTLFAETETSQTPWRGWSGPSLARGHRICRPCGQQLVPGVTLAPTSSVPGPDCGQESSCGAVESQHHGIIKVEDPWAHRVQPPPQHPRAC